MDVLSVILLFLVVSFSSSMPTTESDKISRIVNGQAIDISTVPYHGAIWRTSSGGWAYTCGTAIITTRALLTAAHCVKSLESKPSTIRVTVGTSYRLYGGDVYKISKIYVHKNYSSLTLRDDIAMLVTSKKMSFGKNVDAVFIPNAYYNVPVNKSALVTGFGTTSYLGPIPSVLLAATVNVVSQEECTLAYRRIAAVTSGMICASANNPPKDACQGDSGGPLVADNTLIGIVSFGEGCANTTYPGVYTRVSEYYSWILNNLALI